MFLGTNSVLQHFTEKFKFDEVFFSSLEILNNKSHYTE